MSERESTASKIAADLLEQLNNKVRSELVSHIDEYFQRTDFQKSLAFQNIPESNHLEGRRQNSGNRQVIETLETQPCQVIDDEKTEKPPSLQSESVGVEDQKSNIEQETLQGTPADGNNFENSLQENIDPPDIIDINLSSQEKESPSPNVNVDFLMEMPLRVTFEVGRTRMDIKDLISLGQGSVVELHRFVGEDLDIFVNGKLVARGELVVSKENFGAKISEIISPQDRVKRMGGLAQF